MTLLLSNFDIFNRVRTMLSDLGFETNTNPEYFADAIPLTSENPDGACDLRDPDTDANREIAINDIMNQIINTLNERYEHGSEVVCITPSDVQCTHSSLSIVLWI